MAKKSTADVGFEKLIWEAACKMRGNLDASEYRSVVLGLVFLKFVSDRFQVRYDELVAAGEGEEEDEDPYWEENIVFVPKDARWNVVASAAHSPEIGVVIDSCMRKIEEKNELLENVLPKNFAREELNKEMLGQVVDLFSNLRVVDHAQEKDVLGRVYEYCLAQFASAEGKNAGEFYTPSCVVRTLVEVLQPYEGRVYDPCCGSGGMFVQSSKFIERRGGSVEGLSVYGQEANATTLKLAKMNLAIHGIEADLGEGNADTFRHDLHPDLKANFIMANPPFNLSGWGAQELAEDERWVYGLPSDANANFAWLQHMIFHLAEDGRLGMVLANGSLSSQQNGEGEIRKKIVDADLVDCIVALPGKLFYSTQIPACLWFVSKAKKQAKKTLFVDARKLGTMIDRRHSELTDADVATIADAYRAYVDGTLENKRGFCAVVSTDEIAAQDYVLTPGRYVGIEDQEEDEEPFEEKMTRLTAELSQMFAKSRQLEEDIRKKLGAIGYEI